MFSLRRNLPPVLSQTMKPSTALSQAEDAVCVIAVVVEEIYAAHSEEVVEERESNEGSGDQ